MASLRTRNTIRCSGVIVSSRWVLTAAHCVIYEAKDCRIIIGNADKYGGVAYNVAEHVVHPDFNKRALINDIAMWKTATYMEFSTSAHPISLRKDFVKGGEVAESFQWDSSGNLKVYRMETVWNDKCKATTEKPLAVMDSTLCGVVKIEAGSSCYIDSGAPLVINDLVVGINSWSYGCDKGRSLGFARIETFYNWIADTMEKGAGHAIYPGLLIVLIVLINGIKSFLLD